MKRMMIAVVFGLTTLTSCSFFEDPICPPGQTWIVTYGMMPISNGAGGFNYYYMPNGGYCG